MFFQQKNKLTFGTLNEDSSTLAEKLQAITYVACGCFEGDILDPKKDKIKPVIWRLSDYFDTNDNISFSTESKIMKAFKSLQKNKKDKDKILHKIALKYKLDGTKDISDRDSEFSSDLFYNATEEDDNLLDDENTILNKDRNYFGQEAKTRFWKLYKSDRTFKDQDKAEIKDPRFAFIKTCHEMGMLPKAGMIIRSEKTSHLSFANLGLLQKNSVAVAESLKRYPLEIEALDFTGNGIRPKECILLAEAIETHSNTLIQLNFSENKIGLEGCKALGEALLKMKLLEVINLSGNLLGDDAVNEIVKGMSSLINIKCINFSNNSLGYKASDSEFMENLCLILKNTGTLAELDLSWNNFRGEVAEKLILAMKENYTVKKLNLSYNLFGLATPGIPPAALKIADLLQENVVIEELNLSNNLIDGKVAFCIAYGLQNNTSLKSFEINGNPIGSSGIKFLIQSINNNNKGKVKNIKMKETDTLIQTVKQQIFDPLNVEKDYRLDLSNIYDRVILFHLIDIDEKIFHSSTEEEQIQQGDCFLEAKLGSSQWTPPKERDKDGRWSLGPDPKDTLSFKFSLDPKKGQKTGTKDLEQPKGTLVDYISDSNLEK